MARIVPYYILIFLFEKLVDLAWSYYDGVDEQFGMILLPEENNLKDNWFEIINKQDYIQKGLTFKDIQSIIDFIFIERMRTSCYMTMNYQIPWFYCRTNIYRAFQLRQTLCYNNPQNWVLILSRFASSSSQQN